MEWLIGNIDKNLPYNVSSSFRVRFYSFGTMEVNIILDEVASPC
jgi:hypothetical protein